MAERMAEDKEARINEVMKMMGMPAEVRFFHGHRSSFLMRNSGHVVSINSSWAVGLDMSCT